MDNLKGDRINYIDFLKFIGLTGIFIAHVGSPKWIMMLRSFDVPFMVILSSALAHKSYDRYVAKNLPTKAYIISRIKRLVIPTWIFLTFYFALDLLTSGKLRDVKYYVASFGLTRYGIGYVWIILIYIYSAILIPVFHKIQLSKKGLIALAIIYILYEIAYYFQLGIQNKLIDTTVYYIIPYGVLTYIGFNYLAMSSKQKLFIIILSSVIFTMMAALYWYKVGEPQLVQIAKYPPRLYYMSYGVAWSLALLMFCETHVLNMYENRAIRFVSEHSMWIYLWHIFVLTMYKELHLPEIWFFKLLVVYVVSCIIVRVINVCIDSIEAKDASIFVIKYLRG